MKRSWILKLLCVIAISCVGLRLLAMITTQPHKREENRTASGQHLDANKMAFLSSQTKTFESFSTKSRRNLVIVSHGRSGSSFVGDIFNHHPSVFYLYEPLQTPQRVLRNAFKKTSYSGLVEQFLTGVFRCKFDHPKFLADIETYYRKPGQTHISRAIASPPLCPYTTTDPRWNANLCHLITSENLRSACKDNYNLTVLKVLMSRIPENSIETIFNMCNRLADADCKVVLLIRDPRAVVSSSRLIGFYKEEGELNAKLGTRIYSYRGCMQTEKNLEFVRRLPDSLRRRIKLQRFEDLAIDPLKELSRLFEFAGLPVLENVRIWLNETTHMSREDCERQEDVTCTKDDAWAAANRWRWRVHPHEIDIIEYYCGSVMRLLGYRSVDRSHELLANVKIPLFSNEYEAKHWFFY